MLQQLSQMGKTIEASQLSRQQCKLSNNYAVNERQKELVVGGENEMRICQHITGRGRQTGRQVPGKQPGGLVLQLSLFPSRLPRLQIGYGSALCLLVVTNAIKTRKRRVSFPLSVAIRRNTEGCREGARGGGWGAILDSGRVFSVLFD